MIKYLGSKRRLIPVLEDLFVRSGACTALDMFTGTTRVARSFKAAGAHVTAVDMTRYAEVLARCYIATDADLVDSDRLAAEVARLNGLPGRRGYFTETFCETARYIQPFNGERIDAIRDDLEQHGDDPLFPVLLTSLIEAADRVGVQDRQHADVLVGMESRRGVAPRAGRVVQQGHVGERCLHRRGHLPSVDAE